VQSVGRTKEKRILGLGTIEAALRSEAKRHTAPFVHDLISVRPLWRDCGIGQFRKSLQHLDKRACTLDHKLLRLGPMPPTPPDPNSAGGAHTGTLLALPVGSPPPSGRYLPGAVLSGKYRLDSLLGEGGMGAVWRATNLLLELPVAIKLIRADLDRGALRARLQLEARSAAKLGHPAIVRVYDVGESEFGDPFIVMELLHGETLAKILTYGRMSGARAVQLLLPIIDALGMAVSCIAI